MTTMDTPTRKIDTEWGVLYVSAVDGGSVRLTSTDPNTVDAEPSFSINGVRHRCDVKLSFREIPGHERAGGHHVDDRWHVPHSDIWYGLRRHPDGRVATVKAQSVFQRRVLPELAQWLHGNAISLLEEGRAYWLTSCATRAETARQTLVGVLDRVERMQAALGAGFGIRPDDERLLQYLNNLERVATLGQPHLMTIGDGHSAVTAEVSEDGDQTTPNHPGYEVGQQVRWKKGDRWRQGHLGDPPVERDGSLRVFEDFNGAARALRPADVQLLMRGPRGGRKWVPCEPVENLAQPPKTQELRPAPDRDPLDHPIGPQTPSLGKLPPRPAPPTGGLGL